MVKRGWVNSEKLGGLLGRKSSIDQIGENLVRIGRPWNPLNGCSTWEARRAKPRGACAALRRNSRLFWRRRRDRLRLLGRVKEGGSAWRNSVGALEEALAKSCWNRKPWDPLNGCSTWGARRAKPREPAEECPTSLEVEVGPTSLEAEAGSTSWEGDLVGIGNLGIL